MSARRTYRIGVDIGGTFTDFTLVDDEGRVLLWKEDSTADEPVLAIARGLEALASAVGLELAGLLVSTTLFVHGTTIATNTVIQRNGPRVGLLCTQGFRDVLYFRDGFKPERFNIHLQHPPDFVDRRLRLGVRGRIGARGEELEPLSEDDVRAAVETFRLAGVQSVAVAFLWSVVEPSHEQRAAAIVRDALPGVQVLCSSDVLPEIREWERTSATVLGAYILPGIGAYLRELERLLSDHGLQRRPLIMQINGGCASVGEILRRPVYALASGPAAAPAAASFHASAHGHRDLIVVDMGGTSFDVCLVRDGRPSMSRTINVDANPLGVAGVDVHSVGAGGGSIAWVDAGGALRVGPQSAGASPGPACYGAGGVEPTVTDANVVLGYLAPSAFLGGRRSLDEELARAAVQRVGDALGLSATEAAEGIGRVVDTNMVSAIRAVSIERGVDPRSFTLVAGGGAGGLHATRLARELGIRQVVIPAQAGTLCSFGMTVTDVRHDSVRASHALSSAVDLARLEELFRELETEARERLEHEGFTGDAVSLERWVDARYPGQVHELTIPIGAGGIDELVAEFHRSHAQQFSYAREELQVEFLHWRVTATGRMPVTRPAAVAGPPGSADDARVGERPAYFAGAAVSTPVYSAELLRPGATLSGPAIIQAATTTLVVNPGDRLEVADDLSYLIDVAG